MKIGGRYNWKNQPERLVYIGRAGNWHQFTKVGSVIVWCEVLTEDLHRLEETKQTELVLQVGGRYKCKGYSASYVYGGKYKNWHQFVQTQPDSIEVELLEEELIRVEKVEPLDEDFIGQFAKAMIKKMVLAAEKGRHGWNDPQVCSAKDLQRMLREHVDKGDPVDVANFAMMLWARGEKTHEVRELPVANGLPYVPD